MNVILASQSPYRRALLEERGVPIVCLPPTVDEETLKSQLLQDGISPHNIGLKLAEAKALSVLESQKSDCVVIGSDQLCVFRGEILNKPGTIENNIAQLLRLSGHTHELLTCVCIASTQRTHLFVDVAEFKMKTLSKEALKDYVLLDQPMSCAGGYKYELHGHELFESVKAKDPTAIQGLPMIQTLEILKTEFNIEF